MGKTESSGVISANEQNLYNQGVTPEYLNLLRAQGKAGPLKGNVVNSWDVPGILSNWQGYSAQQTANQNAYSQGIASLPEWLRPSTTTPMPSISATGYGGYGNFNYDPNKDYLQYAQQANAIYSPQMANIDVLSKIQTSKTEQAKIQTREDFATRMKQEIEAINSRGAFFSGGALQQQYKTGAEQTRALTDITLTDQAAQSQFLAQKGQMGADAANYIRSLIESASSSAYQRWKDQADLYYQEKYYKLAKKKKKT